VKATLQFAISSPLNLLFCELESDHFVPDMAAGPASAPTTLVGDEEDYHFFYNPFRKAIVVNE